MILITGGRFQGKSDFACRLAAEKNGKAAEIIKTGSSSETDKENAPEVSEKDAVSLADGETAGLPDFRTADVVDHLESWIRRTMEADGEPGKIVDFLNSENPDAIVILQEAGCGIVPMDEMDRAWREACGRIGCRIADISGEVYRVTCGISQKIKGTAASLLRKH